MAGDRLDVHELAQLHRIDRISRSISSQQDLASIDSLGDNGGMSRLRGDRSPAPEARAADWGLPVTLRLATADDGAALARLAQLDSRQLPAGPLLVAERGGRIEAALSLARGESLADPFRRTAELVELLRCHAGVERAGARDVLDRAAPGRALTGGRPALAGGCP
jgi:hypothetical protein